MTCIEAHISSLYRDELTKDARISFFYLNSTKRGFDRTVHINIISQADYFRRIYHEVWQSAIKYNDNSIGRKIAVIGVQLDDEMKEEDIDIFIQLIYGIFSEELVSHCILLYELCDYFGFRTGMKVCTEIMIDGICAQNVVPLLLCAQEYNMKDLRTMCIQYCKAFAFTKMCYEDLSELPLDLLLELILGSDTVIQSGERSELIKTFALFNNGDQFKNVIKEHNETVNLCEPIRNLFQFCIDSDLVCKLEDGDCDTKAMQTGGLKVTATIKYHKSRDPQLTVSIDPQSTVSVFSQDTYLYGKMDVAMVINVYVITKNETIKETRYLGLLRYIENIGPINVRLSDALTEDCHNQLPVIVEIISTYLFGETPCS